MRLPTAPLAHPLLFALFAPALLVFITACAPTSDSRPAGISPDTARGAERKPDPEQAALGAGEPSARGSAEAGPSEDSAPAAPSEGLDPAGQTPAAASNQAVVQDRAGESAEPSSDAPSSAEPSSAEPSSGSGVRPPPPDSASAPPRPRISFPQRGGVETVTFDDLEVDMEADMKFDPVMLRDRVRELEGKKIRISGFIYPGVFQQTGLTEFPLLKNTECKFGPGGVAQHIIRVELQGGATANFTTRPITVEGILRIDPWEGPDGNTWVLYRMEADRVN